MPSSSSLDLQIVSTHAEHQQLANYAQLGDLNVIVVETIDSIDAAPDVLIIDQHQLRTFPKRSLRDIKASFPQASLIVEHSPELASKTDTRDVIWLPEGLPAIFVCNAVHQAVKQQLLHRQLDASEGDLEQGHHQLSKILDIGTALSAERDHQRLLERILTEARSLACCDAASIFLVDPESTELVFKLTQNDSIEFHFEEKRFPLNSSSVAGYSASTGEVVNLDDVYELPDDCIYKFNSAFDQSMNYRTRSMLVIPMLNHSGDVVGLIQFINRKCDVSYKLTSPELALQHTIPFSEDIVPLLAALASQAAVAIENNVLVDRINMLFDGFVKASVRAIEQRDPTTSGHSFRVAELTCELANVAVQCDVGRFKDVSMSHDEMKELRFAALLHDFGKVGVREHVLTKAKKLTPEAYGQFVYRIAWEKERVKNHYLSLRFSKLKKGEFSSEIEEQIAIEEATKLQRLNDYLQAVADANEPSLLAEGTFEHLKQVREYMVQDVDGSQRGLIEDLEFQALSVKRGSLTADERIEIESHVSHTIEFLKTIPWTPELSRVPAIAGAHHEKLNGCGYPYGLTENEIPLGAKMMTICDIFDALTATDRPYKAAVPLERAITILQSEVESGHVDPDLVRLFCETKSYRVLGM